jgi:hypothetical protein
MKDFAPNKENTKHRTKYACGRKIFGEVKHQKGIGLFASEGGASAPDWCFAQPSRRRIKGTRGVQLQSCYYVQIVHPLFYIFF